jgi:hypothetical protein
MTLFLIYLLTINSAGEKGVQGTYPNEYFLSSAGCNVRPSQTGH